MSAGRTGRRSAHPTRRRPSVTGIGSDGEGHQASAPASDDEERDSHACCRPEECPSAGSTRAHQSRTSSSRCQQPGRGLEVAPTYTGRATSTGPYRKKNTHVSAVRLSRSRRLSSRNPDSAARVSTGLARRLPGCVRVSHAAPPSVANEAASKSRSQPGLTATSKQASEQRADDGGERFLGARQGVDGKPSIGSGQRREHRVLAGVAPRRHE